MPTQRKKIVGCCCENSYPPHFFLGVVSPPGTIKERSWGIGTALNAALLGKDMLSKVGAGTMRAAILLRSTSRVNGGRPQSYFVLVIGLGVSRPGRMGVDTRSMVPLFGES